uniref:C-type lectin domain-containing protein n=1 Tax=Plectus sambesii TaxID=2011161 RepID=A0A914XAR6_9BILA
MLIKVASLVFFALFSVINAQPPMNDSKCPQNDSNCNFIFHDGVCYCFRYIPTTWAHAKETCESDGQNFLSIRDIKASTWLKFNTGSLDFWVGLHKDGDGSLRWADKPYKFDTQGFSDWGSGEPNYSTGSCVSMFTAFSESGLKPKRTWKMTDCEKKFPFICTIPAAATQIHTVST